MGGTDQTESTDAAAPHGGTRDLYVKRGLSDSVESVRGELARVYRDSRKGRISTGDGYRLSLMLATLARLIEQSDIERRLEELERKTVLH